MYLAERNEEVYSHRVNRLEIDTVCTAMFGCVRITLIATHGRGKEACENGITKCRK